MHIRPSIHRRDVGSTRASSEKLFGRYDELVRLVLGFLLTGVIGAYLSHRYTTQQADLTAAAKVFNEHSKLIGDRYFAQYRLTAYLRDTTVGARPRDQSKTDQLLEPYREAVQTWNSARGFNREMIRMYFGDSDWNRERDIHYAFRSWGQALEAELSHPGSVDFKCLAEEVDKFLAAVNAFRAGMAQAMQAGLVGSSRSSEKAQPRDRPETMCETSSKQK